MLRYGDILDRAWEIAKERGLDTPEESCWGQALCEHFNALAEKPDTVGHFNAQSRGGKVSVEIPGDEYARLQAAQKFVEWLKTEMNAYERRANSDLPDGGHIRLFDRKLRELGLAE